MKPLREILQAPLWALLIAIAICLIPFLMRGTP